MSVESRSHMLWRRSVRLVVASIVEQKLSAYHSANKKFDSDHVDHLKWRMALNLYLASAYAKAFQLLNEILRDDKVIKNKYDSRHSSFVYQVGGRCALELFLNTSDHAVLETSYRYYKCAIEHLRSMIHLPALLLEFARVMEYYGAFEAAHDLYTRILTSFPSFRGYFHAFYRSAIVGRYLSSLTTDPSAKEESVNKCIDILQFLLEALPSDIQEFHVLLLYGRTLEQSTNPQVKFRCNAVYKSLYECCKKQRIAMAHTLNPPSAWFNDPITWMALGDVLTSMSEPLLAKDAYDKYVELQQLIAKRYKSDSKNASKAWVDLISIEDCIKLAHNAAHFQNYPGAVKFCEIGLQKDRYHKTLRQLISRYSAPHAATLQHEVDSVYRILSAWKGRCWTEGFRRRLKEQVIAEYEQRYRIDRFDMEARQNLLYYAKDKYRSQFMFEEHCATRLQRFSRHIKRLNMWLSAQQSKYEKKADEAYSKYLRVPLNRAARSDVLDISNVRIVRARLAKHPIHRVKVLIEQQDRAVEALTRCYAAYLKRKAINRLIDRRRRRHYIRKVVAARTIQRVVRQRLEIQRVLWAQQLEEKRDAAVRVIQRWYRTYVVAMFRMSKSHPEKSAYRRRRAFQVLRRRLGPCIARFFGREVPADSRPSGSRMFRASFFYRKVGHRITVSEAHRRISRLVASKISRNRMHRAIMDIRKRNAADHSQSTTRLLGRILADEAQHCYRSPGIDPRGAQFVRLTQQKVVFCDNSKGFDVSDCMMLSMVLRCKGCAITHLVLHKLANKLFEQELLNALRKSHSLRSVHIIGGRWSDDFFDQLFRIVQIDNCRIRCVAIDKVLSTSNVTESIATRAGCLLMDFFNYSIPGIQSLCLHGCSLTGGDLELLGRGLTVNTSLECLELSSNLIDDAGFIALFCALYGNKKSKVMHLDLSQNLIKDTDHAIQKMFENYRPVSIQLRLVVLLISNPLRQLYVPQLTQNLQIIYNASDMAWLMRDSTAGTSHLDAHRQLHQSSSDGQCRDTNAIGLDDKSISSPNNDRANYNIPMANTIVNDRRKVKSSKEKIHTLRPRALHRPVT